MTTYVVTLTTAAALTISVISTIVPNAAVLRTAVVESAQVSYIGTAISTGTLGSIGDVSLRRTTATIDHSRATMRAQTEYPRLIEFASAVVVIGTVISCFVGFFAPGPITGAALALAVTLWWCLYRITLS
jgi:hypothetical protein